MEINNLKLDSEEDCEKTCCDDLDADICDEAELQKLFPLTYQLCHDQALSLKNNYILHMDCINVAQPKICIGLSNGACEVYEFSANQLTKITSFKEKSNVNVKFASEHCVYTGGANGIKLWDLRTSKCESHFQEMEKTLLTFDVSPNDRLLCGGTEIYKGDAFLLFWDIRNVKLLGGYWESHTDDITKVLFHPTDFNQIASGSTDGLINLYDLKETNEDDALTDSFNTESSVEQLFWYKNNGKDAMCCVTHTMETQLWNIEDALPLVKFSREDLAKGIKRKSGDHCYVANSYTDQSGSLNLLTGSSWQNGECLRSMKVTNEHAMIPNIRFIDNKQRVRASYYDDKNELFITGGERGILSVWKQSSQQNNHNFKNASAKKKIRNTKMPY